MIASDSPFIQRTHFSGTMPPVNARDVTYATHDEVPDWQTMIANTVFNNSRIDPDWLIYRKPGMSCQSHTDILGKFLKYNLVSVIVSVVLATPFFHEKLGSSRAYIARSFTRLWRTVRRRKGDNPSQDIPDHDDISTGISITSFLSSIIGSIVISLAAPCFTAISLWHRYRENVNLWVIIQQWATRPRATCYVIAINAFIGRTKAFKDRPHGFIISAYSSMIAEIPLSALSLGFLKRQIRRHKAQYSEFQSMIFFTNCFDEMQFYASELQYMIYVQLFIIGFAIISITVVVVRHFHLGSRAPKQYTMRNDSKYLFIPVCVQGLQDFWVWFCSYSLWKDFLVVTPEDFYCVEDSITIDVIYYLLPVILGFWRAFSAVASKSRPKQKPAVTIGTSEGADRQNQKDIQQAQCGRERQSLMDNRCLETQCTLRHIKRSATI